MPSPPRLPCAVLALAAAACRAPAPAPAPPPRAEAAPAPPPSPRYLVLEPTWIERASGLDRVLADGRRLDLRGFTIAHLGPADPTLDGGARLPAWSPPGAPPYRFWKGRQLFAAAAFDGALRPVARLPAEPRRAFDWLGGVGLLLPGGALVAPASGGPPVPLGVSAVVDAIAADARRGLVTTALGHAFLTLDGGASYRDVSAELGSVAALQVRGEDIVATLSDGRERFVSPTGAIVGAPSGLPVAARGRRPPDEPDRYLGGSFGRALDAAVSNGIPLPGGGVLVADEGFAGRLDLDALRTTSLVALEPALKQANCAPLLVSDTLLLACADDERAAVVDLGGAPRTERTFDLSGAPALHRFVGVDGEALGYLGPCDGPAPPRDDLDSIVAGGAPANAGRERTPVFCARAGRDAWIEHRLDPADAADVIAWIPRPGGAAVALVARWGSFLDDAERVTVRGPLRVVRVARNEPPFAISPFGWEPEAVLDRSLRVAPDDTIEGWLTESGNGVGTVSVHIDARGHASAFPGPPRAATLTTAGRFALAQGEDGKLWETSDSGRRWLPVERPPSALRNVSVTSCSPAGCRLGPYARLGWSQNDAAPAAPLEPLSTAPAEPPRPPHPPPRPPLLRLSCAFDGAPQGRHVEGSSGFGYTPTPQPRGNQMVRIGQLGMAELPYSGSTLLASGDAQLAWVTPLDTSAALHRAALPLTRVPLGSSRPSELSLGWLLTPDGGLATFALGAREPCFSDLLELPGIARPFGGCAAEPSLGVDLGGRVLFVHADQDNLFVSAADAAPPAKGRGPGRPAAGAVRELHTTSAGQDLKGFVFGVGTRSGAPVLVALDGNGDASLAPIDSERGTLGAEERLRPFPEAELGSAPTCAPRPGEATVVLPFADLLALDRGALRGISSTGSPGVAVLRWSRERVCLDAAELPVRDERFDESLDASELHGALRKVIARFDARGGKTSATLLLISPGSEVRQRLRCQALLPGEGR